MGRLALGGADVGQLYLGTELLTALFDFPVNRDRECHLRSSPWRLAFHGHGSTASVLDFYDGFGDSVNPAGYHRYRGDRVYTAESRDGPIYYVVQAGSGLRRVYAGRQRHGTITHGSTSGG